MVTRVNGNGKTKTARKKRMAAVKKADGKPASKPAVKAAAKAPRATREKRSVGERNAWATRQNKKQLIIWLPLALRDDVNAAAHQASVQSKEHISAAEWARRALREKLDRERAVVQKSSTPKVERIET